jgi:hypothetical protein
MGQFVPFLGCNFPLYIDGKKKNLGNLAAKANWRLMFVHGWFTNTPRQIHPGDRGWDETILRGLFYFLFFNIPSMAIRRILFIEFK